MATVPARDIGEVVGDRLRIHADGELVDAAVSDLKRIWDEALPRALGL